MRRLSFVRLLAGLLAAGAVWGSALAQERLATRVSVASQPAGATVIIDGVEKGITPTTLYDLVPGRHHLKCRLPGYYESDGYFNTNEGPSIEKNVVLEAVKGLLLIKTEPAGADIQVDGVSVGRSPKLITNLAAKDAYRVKLRKAGYQDQEINVKFDGRTPQVREEKLVLASGTIDIVTEPEGVEVTVNGIVKGRSPLKVTEVPRGRATVKFHLDGFADEVRELAINAGDEQTLSIGLKGLPGTLHLVSVPEGARFYLNGEARGKGPLSIPGLKPGDYQIRAELEGYGTMSKTVHLNNGESSREEFKLSNVMGRLEVRTSPIGAQVFLDGRAIGSTRSKDMSAEFSDVLPIESVLEGEHTLVVRAEGYAEATIHPRVENSKTVTKRIRLKRIFLPNVEIVTARGSYKGVLKEKSGNPDYVEVEVSLGVMRSFARDEIRKINWLNKPEK